VGSHTRYEGTVKQGSPSPRLLPLFWGKRRDLIQAPVGSERRGMQCTAAAGHFWERRSTVFRLRGQDGLFAGPGRGESELVNPPFPLQCWWC
jgi:hypothetical protein